MMIYATFCFVVKVFDIGLTIAQLRYPFFLLAYEKIHESEEYYHRNYLYKLC